MIRDALLLAASVLIGAAMGAALLIALAHAALWVLLCTA